MRIFLVLGSALLLAACGSKGPPVPDWKTDSANYIERYKKAYLMGENTLADRQFTQALDATSGAGRIAETARLWLIQCALHKASLETDNCETYANLAQSDSTPADRAYYLFLTGRWDQLDVKFLPSQYAPLLKAATGDAALSNAALNAIADPLSRLIGASLLLNRKQTDDATLALAAETASDQGWRRPLLVYLKLEETRARERGDTTAQSQLAVRIKLLESTLRQP
ncbi:MAG TPA: lipoprotein [Thiobacillaceae bacterium]|nr:lipoprotein [Thiobacillaceae bacterium]